MRAWTHWATSGDLLALRLPAHDAGTGLGGRPLGVAQFGRAFALDSFDAYGAGVISNPNVVVAGAIGTGKSTVVKMQVERGLARGRRAVVLDPKGEYGSLAARRGVVPIRLGVDGWCDPFGEDGAPLVRSLLASAQGAPLRADQLFALDEAWRRLPRVRPRRLLRALFDRVAGYLGGGPCAERELATLLHRFVEGDLASLFDGDGEPLDFTGDLVVLDLSRQWSSASLPLAALSAVAAAQQVVARDDRFGYLVIDEAWALLADEQALAWLRGSWKLARARGVAHVLVLHRWSDVGAVGDLGSARREAAQGLLRECETAWLFRQPPDEADEMARVLALSSEERGALAHVGRGVALVRYGPHRSIVRVEPDEGDRTFIDTDGAMRTS